MQIFMARDIFSKRILVGTDSLRVYSQWKIYQQGTEETGKQPAQLGSMTCVLGPTQRQCIVSDVEKDRVWIIGVGGCGYYMQGGNIVGNDCYKLKHVDGNELAVLVILSVEKGTQLHLLRKFNVPLELQFNGVSSSAFQ